MGCYGCGVQGSPYRLVERLGGTRADVWLAVVEGLEGFRRPVVLKRVPHSDPQGIQDLRREAQITARLHHPNLIAALDLFEAPREVVLALEHVLGVDARELARPVPWSTAARIVGDAAQGMAHVHDLRDGRGRPLGVAHGDLTIANLMISGSGHTKVIDFGIARRAGDAHDRQVVHGTRGFLSPEQAAGQPIDWRSDVFSLGRVFAHLMTPRGGFQQTYVGAASSTSGLDAPETVKALLRRMLAVEPGRRPRMQEVADLLEPVASQYGADARAVASFVRSGSLERLEARRQRLAAHVELPDLDELLPLGEPSDEQLHTRLDELGEPTEIDGPRRG